MAIIVAAEDVMRMHQPDDNLLHKALRKSREDARTAHHELARARVDSVLTMIKLLAEDRNRQTMMAGENPIICVEPISQTCDKAQGPQIDIGR
jgi:hypothetical protein